MLRGILKSGSCSLTVGWCSPKAGSALKDACSVGSAACAGLLLDEGASPVGLDTRKYTHRIKRLIHEATNKSTYDLDLYIQATDNDGLDQD
jgi:hypothetical protein